MKPSEIVKSLKMLAIFEGSQIGATEVLNEAANLIQSLIPRPIEEAPLCSWNITMRGKEINYTYKVSDDQFCDVDGRSNITHHTFAPPTHFIPLSAIQALMESGD